MTTPQASRSARVSFIIAQVRAGRALSDLALQVLGLTPAEITLARALAAV